MYCSLYRSLGRLSVSVPFRGSCFEIKITKKMINSFGDSVSVPFRGSCFEIDAEKILRQIEKDVSVPFRGSCFEIIGKSGKVAKVVSFRPLSGFVF